MNLQMEESNIMSSKINLNQLWQLTKMQRNAGDKIDELLFNA